MKRRVARSESAEHSSRDVRKEFLPNPGFREVFGSEFRKNFEIPSEASEVGWGTGGPTFFFKERLLLGFFLFFSLSEFKFFVFSIVLQRIHIFLKVSEMLVMKS